MRSSDKEYPHLKPAPPTRDKVYVCDLCYRSEIDEILGSRHGGSDADLIPMYLDGRDGVVVCRGCAESGAHIDMGGVAS